MNKIIETIAEQIGWRELRFAGFKFAYSDKDLSLKIYKGVKHFEIRLNEALDDYEITTFRIKGFEVVEERKETRIYCDQLSDKIEEFFKFEYINKVVFG